MVFFVSFFVCVFPLIVRIERSKYFCALNCRNVGVGREREQVGATEWEDGRTKVDNKDANEQNREKKLNQKDE